MIRNIKVTLILLMLVTTFTYPVSSLEITQNEEVKDLENKFKGNVYVVVSNYTFSTAVDFAAMVKDHDAGVIMGKNTGGLPSSYGDIIRDELPNSKLGFGISYKYFLRPAGFDNGKPILVDEKIDVNKLKYWHNDSGYKNMIIKSIIYKRRCSV